MIENLTKAQEDKMEEYADKWIGIGLSTERISYEETVVIIKDFYKHVLKYNENPMIIIMDNPIDAFQATSILANILENHTHNQVWNQVWNRVENQISNQVWNQVFNQVRNQVYDQVSNQVSNQVFNQVRNQVRNQVYDQVWNQVRNQVEGFVFPYLEGSFDSCYYSYYDYIENELGVELIDTFKYYKALSKLHYTYCYPNWCVVSQKPKEIHMINKKLHNLNGPSISYSGINPLNIYSYEGQRISKDDFNLIQKILSSKTSALLNLNHDNSIIRSVAHNCCKK